MGANASHRFTGPIFEDGTFEFLPIPESPDLSSPTAIRYRDLRSWYDPDLDLRRYVPPRLWDTACHNDPEFVTYTYGDNCDLNPRGSGLKRLRPGDFLFFIVRLQSWRQGRATDGFGFYLIGYLRIAGVDWLLSHVTQQPTPAEETQFGNNAHVVRGHSGDDLWDGFWVFRGGSGSRRFRQAVPVTRELCEAVFRSADGRDWQWGGGRSDLQIIGSYTRACRMVLDPTGSDDADRTQLLWDWVGAHSG